MTRYRRAAAAPLVASGWALAWLATLLLVAAAALAMAARADEAAANPDGTITSHGLSIFGDLKYPADFKHFDYVNPDAPKGGSYRTWQLGSYDSLTPFTEKGDADSNAWIVFDSLMVSSLDSLDQMYGLIAESVTYPPDKQWVSFRMRPEARFSDGSPLTADDVVFTFDMMKNKGQLRYRAYFGDIEKVEALAPHEVKFTFRQGAPVRDLLQTVASTDIFSRAYYKDRDFSRASMDPPLGSGPYQVEKADAGRTVIYRRNPDYWARDLPVNVGANNFDEIRVDYYADQASAFEAFKAGEYTIRGETNADRWLTGYDFPAVQKGDVVKAEIPARTVPYAGGVFFNLRRPAFQDARVREAIETLFNFEAFNAKLFHGVERRAPSYWERSAMAASGPTPPDEQAVLEPLLGALPDGIGDVLADPAAVPFAGEGAGENNRPRLRAALALLTEAGYKSEGGKLIGPDGKQLRFEIMYASPDAEQYLSPFVQGLIATGIDASLRFVDSAQWRERAETFDFDGVLVYVPMSDTPGQELSDAFGSDYAKIGGSLNVSGVASPGIDKLITEIQTAQSRDALDVNVRALDRVLRALTLRVPLWVRPDTWMAYYDFYRHPDPLPPYATGAQTIWWADLDRYNALKAAGTIR